MNLLIFLLKFLEKLQVFLIYPELNRKIDIDFQISKFTLQMKFENKINII